MQSTTVDSAHNPSGASTADVVAALRGVTGSRRWSFRYELLDASLNVVRDLTNVLSGTVTMSWLADIKRTAKFKVRDDGAINFLSDHIKPWVRLHLPPYGDNDWVEWPQGVFLLSSPARQADAANVVTRDVDAYDRLLVYSDDKVTTRYSVASGTTITTEVSTLLGSVPKTIATSAATTPTAKEWEPGTTKLRIINDLLDSINYESLSMDENGTAVVKPYVSPSARGEEYTYADDTVSVMFPETSQEFDLFSVANKWTLVVNDPDRTVLTSTYTNTSTTSPTSTVRRNRTIVDFRVDEDAADQASLDARVARLAFEASQVYEVVPWKSGLMPIHAGNDVYRITYSPLGINAKYAETDWTLPLAAGGVMEHKARRVVTV